MVAASPEVARCLLANRCSPSFASGKEGLTALHVAARADRPDLCMLWLRSRAAPGR
ncbi:unnamed protein product [Prorocentrum cordatum]|uniref:Uncharacterized protein n=1 Tax=Prorocentrum cordatum TaxID=2364126 RepID=A0ABN9VZX2_9DINO|nr:unnamed protein product [Polarella glacialis]